MRILVVEDNVKMAESIRRGLKERGYVVDLSHDGEDGMHLATTEPYDLVILDIMLPKYDGVQILKRMREKELSTPVIFLTAKDAVDDRIKGLDAGADDYIVKPFSYGELMARVRAHLRRSLTETASLLKVGDLTLDLEKHEARRGDKVTQLSSKEFVLLKYFMQNVDKVLTRTAIGEHVWDMNFTGLSNVVDVYVNYVRNKVDRGFEMKLIHTIRGVGYVMRSPD
ncbi:MAG: response regulator [Planctomycetes bacterium]|nr:response regulator [Planctomycetota bacterium]